MFHLLRLTPVTQNAQTNPRTEESATSCGMAECIELALAASIPSTLLVFSLVIVSWFV